MTLEELHKKRDELCPDFVEQHEDKFYKDGATGGVWRNGFNAGVTHSKSYWLNSEAVRELVEALNLTRNRILEIEDEVLDSVDIEDLATCLRSMKQALANFKKASE